MIRKIASLFIISVILTLSISSNTSAQDSADAKLFLSPSLKVVEYSEGQEFINDSVSLKNTFSREIRVQLKAAIVVLVSGEIEIIEDTKLQENIIISDNDTSLTPNQLKSIDIQIKNPQDFVEGKNPAILLTETGNDINEQVELTPQIVSVFLLENINDKVQFDVFFTIEKSSIIDPEYTLKGRIENTGQRVISPSGLITIFKQQTQFQTIELTSDIYTPLLPGQSIDFERTGSFDFNDPIKETGQFTVEVKIKPNPFSTVLTKSQTILHFHRTVFIIIVTSLVVAIILIAYLISVILNQEKRAKLTENIKKNIPFKKNGGIVKQEPNKTASSILKRA